MSQWNLFIDKATGDLVSEGAAVPEGIDTERYEVRELSERPDWGTSRWDEASRAIVERPEPSMIDRLDDLEARFMADPDFAAVWGSLSGARKTQLRTGILRVLSSILRGNRYRRADEPAELD